MWRSCSRDVSIAGYMPQEVNRYTEDLKASSVDKVENKPKNDDQGKKKKKRSRALKITNTHMKAFVSVQLPAVLSLS